MISRLKHVLLDGTEVDALVQQDLPCAVGGCGRRLHVERLGVVSLSAKALRPALRC